MTEQELMAEIRSAVYERGLIAYHTRDSRGSWSNGFPDLIIAGPGGVIFREVKSMRGRLTESQWTWGHRLLKAGANYDIWRPPCWPEAINDELDRLAKV